MALVRRPPSLTRPEGTRGSAFGATTPRRLESRHGGGRGAEAGHAPTEGGPAGAVAVRHAERSERRPYGYREQR